ncbi:MAG TPA: hypothetical protein PLL36_13970 [Candidatus Hydrogenedentes bacterium]|nr:hypothetical protein [Candidatus Hydrogenedentota bacterium]
MKGDATDQRTRRFPNSAAAALRNITGNTPEQAVLWYADCGEAHAVDISQNNVDDVLVRARKALEGRR